MKRLVLISLACFLFAGCGSVDNTAVPPENPTPPPEVGALKSSDEGSESKALTAPGPEN